MERPDVQYVARGLARVMSKATSRHVKIMTRLVKYLVKFPKVEYIFEEQTATEEVRCFVDANWGGEYDARSVSGGALLIGGSLVLTWSRTQGSTALSSAESELYATASGAIEAEHAAHVLEEILGTTMRMIILTDSSAAKAALEKAGVGKMRHIQLRHMFIKGTAGKMNEARESERQLECCRHDDQNH